MEAELENKKVPLVIEVSEEEKPRRHNLRERKARRKESSADDLILPAVIPATQQKRVQWIERNEREEFHLIIRISLAQWNVNLETEKLGFEFYPLKFDLKISHTIQNESISIQIKLSSKKARESYVDISGRCSWVQHQLQSKLIKANKKVSHGYNSCFKHKIKESSSDVFIDLKFTPLFETNAAFRGLINQGNTCYMNSYLQMLYHLPKLRQIVFDLQKGPQGKFPATLQTLFFKLSTSKNKSVSTEQLSKSYGWSKKDVDIQQDIQEFSCLMLEALQKKVRQQSNQDLSKKLHSLFGGKLIHYVQCLDGIDYRSENEENFLDLQLNIQGMRNLIESLESYMSFEILEGDNMYKTEDFGLCRAEKGVSIKSLPEVLMIHLKRFEYDFETGINKKILARYEYPATIDFTSMTKTKTPHYKLYGVLVHEGERANCGHYYSFIKIKDKWYKFNDEVVTEASEGEVFEHNFGGKQTVNIFDNRELTISQKQVQVESTAYMLVYYNSALEKEIFGKEDIYPQWLEEERVEEDITKAKASETVSVSLMDWFTVKESDVFSCGLVSQTSVEDGGVVEMAMINEMFPNSESLTELVNYLSNINNINPNDVTCWIHDIFRGRDGLVNPYSIKPEPTFQDIFKDKSDNLLVLLCKKKGLIKEGAIDNFSQNAREEKKEEVMMAEEQENPLMRDADFQQELRNNNVVVCVIKLYHVNAKQEISFTFVDYLYVHKDSLFQPLRDNLEKEYGEANHTLFYYREKKGFDLEFMQESNLISPEQSRNRLAVFIVQKMHTIASSAHGLLQSFTRERTKISVKLKCDEDGSLYEKFLPREMSVAQLRRFINHHIYQSHIEEESAFITVKYKSNKATRNLTQAFNGNVDSMTKYDKTITFGRSIIKASERETCGIYSISYRNKKLEETAKVDIICSKKIKANALIDKAFEQVVIRDSSRSDNLGSGYRLVLFDPEKSRIQRAFDEEDEVWNAWNKSKGLLVVESNELPVDDSLLLFVHHKTRSGQAIGTPFTIDIPNDFPLKDIYSRVLSLSSRIELQFQEKVHELNCLKVKVTVYPKELSPSKGVVVEAESASRLSELFPETGEFNVEVSHLSIFSAVQAMRISVDD